MQSRVLLVPMPVRYKAALPAILLTIAHNRKESGRPPGLWLVHQGNNLFPANKPQSAPDSTGSSRPMEPGRDLGRHRLSL